MCSREWQSFTALRTNQSASLAFTHKPRLAGKLVTFLSPALCAVRQPSAQAQFPATVLSLAAGITNTEQLEIILGVSVAHNTNQEQEN
jgi:hypothetical protein